MSADYSRETLQRAADAVHAIMPPTPQYRWPLLCERLGTEIWAKHENQTPCGAFKVRGGILYVDDLLEREPDCPGVIAATRGNHGQSVASAATRRGLKSTIVVPRGNSVEKNAAMRSQGAELIEHGDDFQEAFEHAGALAADRGLHMFASYHPILVRGVASYALELFGAVPDLDTVYVPIGMGSGICAVIAARDALGLSTRVVGVVADGAPAYALSFERHEAVSTNRADTFADGVACRVPLVEALEIIWKGADRVVSVSDLEIEAAVRHIFTDTHNVAEGAGAAPLAAAIKEKDRNAGRKVAVVLSGGNIDRRVYQDILRRADDSEARTA